MIKERNVSVTCTIIFIIITMIYNMIRQKKVKIISADKSFDT